MAILWVREMFNGRTGDTDPLVSKFVRVFLVRSDSMTQDTRDILDEAAIPEEFEEYESPDGTIVSSLLCSKRRVRYLDGSYGLWEVTCEYDTATNPDLDGPYLARPLEVRCKIGRQTVVATTDYAGQAIRNSAGEPFDPAAEADETYLILSMVRYEAAFEPDKGLTYVDSTNSLVWNGYTVGTCLMRDFAQEPVVQNGEILYRTSYEVWIKESGWKRLILDKGYRTKDSLTEKVARDEWSGEVYTTPVLLDGSGGKLPVTGTPVFLEFTMFPAVDWTPLGLILP